MTRNRAQLKPPAPISSAPPTVGPGRYTVERFLGNCSEPSKEYLLTNWKEGNQLNSDEVPTDALPCVVIMACYARQYGVDLVDDYVRLLDRYWEELPECFHADKFFASCIVILDETGQVPTDQGFEDIKVPELYDQFFNSEEEA